MTIRVSKGPRRGSAWIEVDGITATAPLRFRLSRDVPVADGTHFTERGWGNTAADLLPRDVRSDGNTVRLLVGPEVVNVIEGPVHVTVSIPDHGITETVLWPELEILPGAAVGSFSSVFEGSRPISAGELEISPATLTLARGPDGRLLVGTFRLTSTGGSGRIKARSGDGRLAVKPFAGEVSPEQPLAISVEWLEADSEPAGPVDVVFTVGDREITKRVVAAPKPRPQPPAIPSGEAPPPPPEPPPLPPTPTTAPTSASSDIVVSPMGRVAVHVIAGSPEPAEVVYDVIAPTSGGRVSVDIVGDGVTALDPSVATLRSGGRCRFRFEPNGRKSGSVDIVFDINGRIERRGIDIVVPRGRAMRTLLYAALAVLSVVIVAATLWLQIGSPSAPPSPRDELAALRRDPARCRQSGRFVELADLLARQPTPDVETANDALTIASECGNAEALYRIGRDYDPVVASSVPHPVAALPDTALAKYHDAARKGHAGAATALGELCSWLRVHDDERSEAVTSARNSFCQH